MCVHVYVCACVCVCVYVRMFMCGGAMDVCKHLQTVVHRPTLTCLNIYKILQLYLPLQTIQDFLVMISNQKQLLKV